MSAASPAPESPAPAPPAKRGSPLRLGILLAILAIVVGALGYDYLIARPAMVAANGQLEELMNGRLGMGVGKGKLPHSADVQKVIGFAPTRTEKYGADTIEWYCWWGKVPYLSERRRYLWVKYEGPEPQHVAMFDYETNPGELGPMLPPSDSDPDAPRENPGQMGHSKKQPGVHPAQPKESSAAEPPAALSPE